MGGNGDPKEGVAEGYMRKEKTTVKCGRSFGWRVWRPGGQEQFTVRE